MDIINRLKTLVIKVFKIIAGLGCKWFQFIRNVILLTTDIPPRNVVLSNPVIYRTSSIFHEINIS